MANLWRGSVKFAERERVRLVRLQGFDGSRQDSCLPLPEKRRRRAGITRDPGGPIRDTSGFISLPRHMPTHRPILRQLAFHGVGEMREPRVHKRGVSGFDEQTDFRLGAGVAHDDASL